MRRLCATLLAFLVLGTAWFVAPTALAQTPSPQGQLTPRLIVPVPDLTFSEVTVVEEQGGDAMVTKQTVIVPFIADYLAAIYKYAIATGGIFATVLMMVGGFEYLVGNQKSGMSRIKGAVTGLVLVFGTYVILRTVNPALVNVGGIGVEVVRRNLDYLPGSLSSGLTASGESVETAGVSSDYSGTVERAAATFNPTADRIAAGLGLNACMWKAQIYMETRWTTGTSSTCCFGLGAVSAEYAMAYLNNQRSQIQQLHSQRCPTCPGPGLVTDKKKDAAGFARDLKQTQDWLLADNEGNLIISALMRKQVASSTPNPIATTMAYGMGVGSYNSYKEHQPCTPEKFSESELAAQLGAGTSLESLLNKACPVPGQWPVAYSDSAGASSLGDCPATIPDRGPDPTPRACCTSTGPICERPKPKIGSNGKSQGRIGVCQSGARAGQACAAVAGAGEYAATWLKLVQGCLAST